ncbi:MAG TPA: hypothetical protein VGL34_10835 [Steroidobacteraceae bacterium]|jgi:hypothetical protein
MKRLTARGLKSAAELSADRPHGDRLKYIAGCRCDGCRRSNADYERMRQAARVAGDWNGIVSAAPARAHLLALSRIGVGRMAVHDATDLAYSILHDIRHGKKLRIRARTARKILAVSAAQRADRAIIPGKRTYRLIERLLEEGYTKAQLARELGYSSPALQFRKGSRVTLRSEARMIALHHRLTT